MNSKYGHDDYLPKVVSPLQYCHIATRKPRPSQGLHFPVSFAPRQFSLIVKGMTCHFWAKYLDKVLPSQSLFPFLLERALQGLGDGTIKKGKEPWAPESLPGAGPPQPVTLVINYYCVELYCLRNIGKYLSGQLMDPGTHHKEPTWWLEASYRKLAQLGSVCMKRNSNSSRRHSLRRWKQIWGGEKDQTPQSHLPCKALSSLENIHGSGLPCPGSTLPTVPRDHVPGSGCPGLGSGTGPGGPLQPAPCPAPASCRVP